jgi:hypothetical protein
MQELAQEAINIQNACNLGGLVHSWSRSMGDLQRLLREQGTCAVNEHPISKLWASKIHELTEMGMSDYGAFSKAYAECKKLAEVET